jgi:hypothetical protein
MRFNRTLARGTREEARPFGGDMRFGATMTVLLSLGALAACGADSSLADGAASGGCEPAGFSELHESDTMLPGHQCMVCHADGGGGGSPDGGRGGGRHWLAAGTVFASGAAACNPGGVSGVVVELLTTTGTVVASATTNSVGNFRLNGTQAFPLRARITHGTTVVEMPDPVQSGDCASCHNTQLQPRINVP